MIPKQLYLPHHLNPMMPVYMCIKNSILALSTKKVTKTAKADIYEIINAHGIQAQKFMFSCFVQTTDCREIREKCLSSSKVAFLGQLIVELSTRESFIYYFADVLACSSKNPYEYVQTVIKYFKLPIQIKITMALSFYLSENAEVSKQGLMFLKAKLGEYYQQGKPASFTPKVLEELLFQIRNNPQLYSDVEDAYHYLLDTNAPDKNSDVRFYHFINKSNRVFNYEPPLITKPAEIIKKADIMRDLGPYCTFNIESLKTVLQELGPLTEEDVFECLMVMAEDNTIIQDSVDRFMTDLMVANKKISKADEWKKFYTGVDLTEKKMQAAWNVDSFLTYAVQNVPNLKWTSVLGYLDRLNLQFKSQKQFVNLFKFFQKAKKQGPKYRTPQVVFFKRWNHPKSQLHFLNHLFKSDQPDLFALSEINNKKVSRSFDGLKNSNLLQYQMWAYPDLVQLIVELSDYDFLETRELFEIPLTNCPELLLQTLSEINFTKGDALLNELYSQLLPVYINNHINHLKLLETLWETNEDLIISSICEIYKSQCKKENSSLNLSKVLDITQNIRDGLIPLSSWNDYSFSVALGILAGKREFLHFEQWIKERLKNVGGPFLNAVLQYVEDNFLKQIREYIVKFGANSQSIHQFIDIQLQKAQLSRELLAFVYESSLQFPSNKFTTRGVEMLKKQYRQICQHFPEMTDNQVIDEIELQAEKNFFRIYKQEVSLEETIEMMQNLRNSLKQEEKELYASMITYLFTELRFHSNYPDKELIITANLFAAIINAKFIEKKLFTVLLQVLSDDLKYNDRRYIFSVTVIDKIKDRLAEEPQFVEGLLDCDQLIAKNPEIIKDMLEKFNPPLILPPEKLLALKASLDSKFVPAIIAEPEKVILPPKQAETVETDVDLLEIEEKIEKIAKSSPNIGKLNLFCNTLTKESLKQKLGDLKKWLDSKEIIKWFSYHLLFKRITSCQVTMFNVYYDLLSDMPSMAKPVISLTYKVLQKWFALQGKSVNDKKFKSFKNIGLWLGKITLGRSEPLLITKLDLKEILIKSFSEKTRLQMNLEVIAKILESKAHDQYIFSLKNPWIAPIFGVMRQLNGKSSDNNIKGEIQRLFKNLSITDNDIPETNFLSSNVDKSSLTIAELPEYIQICEQELKVYIDKGVDLKKIIAQAVDSAIQEIVPPVISRSVTIALVTTKQLALKDFLLEPDDQKLLKGTHHIAQNLAGSLALVTCREPLKMSLNTFLRKKLQEYAFLTESDNQSIISAATRDNLNLGCALIKRAVIEKALDEISKDQTIQEQLEKRREAKANNQPFINESYYLDLADVIPEVLRPRVGGLSDDEFMIYEDFQRDKRYATSSSKQKDVPGTRQKLEKIMALVDQGQSPQNIKEFMIRNDFVGHAEFGEKLILLLFQHKDPFSKYFLELFKLVRHYSKPEQNYDFFIQNMVRDKVEYNGMITELCSIGYFPSQAIMAETQNTAYVEIYQDAEYQQNTRLLLKSWVTQGKSAQEYYDILSDKFANGVDEEVIKFFYFTILYSVGRCIRSATAISDVMDFKYIDEVSKLIVVTLKIVSNNRSIYLDHVLKAINMVIDLYHNYNTDIEFNQRPFFRLILSVIQSLSEGSIQKFDENSVLMIYSSFSTFFHKLKPLTYPGFSFAWLQLVSNKFFMSAILERYEYWDLYHELLLDVLKFAKSKLTLEALAANEELKTYYKGILRLVTILLHDFPDFSSEFSFTLSNQVPDRFVQLRNVILSAFPQSQWFPEPQTIQFKDLETIKYMKELPKYYKSEHTREIPILGIFKDDDKLLSTKSQLDNESSRYINLFVLNAGFAITDQSEEIQQVNYNQENEKQVNQLLFWLLSKSQNPLQEKLIKGILNLIRFPNLLTLFFIKLVSKILYQEANPNLQENIVKAIFERMAVEKPHPWGMIFVVHEIRRNKKKLAHLEIKEFEGL